MRDYLSQPFPNGNQDYRDVDYLALDLETTGLNAKKDVILSFGYVSLRGATIDLSTACHQVVRISQAIPEASAVIHQITDDQAAQGDALEDALGALLTALAGKVMIAHHARIEVGFVGAACKHLYGQGLLVPVVDTQAVAHRTLERRQIAFKGSDLRLHALGDRYNLPRYGAHNALSDALAAAELFLAQAAHKDVGKGLALREFY